MSRGLTTAAEAAAKQEVVTRTVAVDLDFVSGIVRANGSPTSIWIGGQEYVGLFPLGAISPVEETIELKATGLTLVLTGIPNDLVAAVLADGYRNRRAQVWEVLLDSAWQPIADPVLVFRGRMDQVTIAVGDSATVTVALENRLRDWERAPNILWTHEEQVRQYPGDTFFGFMSNISQRDVKWGFAP